MKMAFSRGLYTGWFRGINNQELVHGRFGKKRGVYLGGVESVRTKGVLVRLMGPLKPGDGVVFDSGHPEEKEEGGRVYEIRERLAMSYRSRRREEADFPQAQEIRRLTSAATTQPALLTFGHGDINFDRIQAGDKGWKTSDPELDRRLR